MASPGLKDAVQLSGSRGGAHWPWIVLAANGWQSLAMGLQPWVHQQSLSGGTVLVLKSQQACHEAMEAITPIAPEARSHNTCF